MKCDTKESSIHVRVPVEEKELITELATRAGVKPSEVIQLITKSVIDKINPMKRCEIFLILSP